MRHHLREGLLALHAGIFLFAVTALFSKLIALPALEITLFRSLFAAAALWLYIRILGEPLALAGRSDYVVVALLGALLAGHWATYFHAMQVASVAVGVIALHTYPVITVFLEPLFHGERPRAADVVGALAVLVGIYLLVPRFDLTDATFLGVLWGVFSALLYALRNIVQRRYFCHHPAHRALFYQVVVAVFVFAPFGGAAAGELSPWQWGQLALLGVFFTALPHTLFAHSLRYFKAKTVSLVGCLQVVYATALAGLLLGERPGMSTVLGGLIVVGAAMYESYAAGRGGVRRTRLV